MPEAPPVTRARRPASTPSAITLPALLGSGALGAVFCSVMIELPS
jgi:hypothetical protein